MSRTFRSLHERGAAFVLPNAWDEGSARLLEREGFDAIATTSAGFALTRGRPDYAVTREDAIAHAGRVAAAVAIPVTADLENGWGARPEDAAETIRMAIDVGLAGGSIEDFTGDENNPSFDEALAVERIAAAVEAARAAPRDFVLTARADGLLHGARDLDAIIARLQRFAEAGADVVYAPGLASVDAARQVCESVETPVNILMIGPLATAQRAEMAQAGAARLSLGGALAFSAYGALIEDSQRLREGRFDVGAARRATLAPINAALQG